MHASQQVLRINKANSVDVRQQWERHQTKESVALGVGRAETEHQKEDKTKFKDRKIKEKLYAARLTKWRLFIYCDKFLNFDKDDIYNALHKGNRKQMQL